MRNFQHMAYNVCIDRLSHRKQLQRKIVGLGISQSGFIGIATPRRLLLPRLCGYSKRLGVADCPCPDTTLGCHSVIGVNKDRRVLETCWRPGTSGT